MQLTLLLLCKGNKSKVRTERLLRAIPRAAMPEPVKVPAVVITAAPPVPARNVEVPDRPMAVKAVPNPAPIIGASKPADSPMTRPPPTEDISRQPTLTMLVPADQLLQVQSLHIDASWMIQRGLP